ncbi:hypothetical protein [Emticicia sp. 21SJ11W-3]|uniref:hypothetical protein n=1 Tax=Emticicia sp. 21SJ11W-3 TaxID=2916755 RepID=UPI00209D58F5|nr:hypothetical protein [Emticicia sp. 21SJ11W-3]UTA68693.1 hypothetical protein MB380_02550 [Emticicia sp. 21SJ11W-3]
MKIRLLLLLAIGFLSCNVHNSKGSLQKTCLIRQNGVLVEKRYLSPKGTPTSIITYEKDEKTPRDSIIFNEYLNVTAYVYDNGSYSINDLLLVKDYYTEIYNIDSTCNLYKTINHRILIEDSIANLCYIANSVLSDGTDASTKAVVTKSLNGIRIKYLRLNSLFLDLPEVLQSYFYEKTLCNVSLYIEEGYLKEEIYIFENGNASRHFIYEKGFLKESKLEVRYFNNNETPIKTIRTYELK